MTAPVQRGRSRGPSRAASEMASDGRPKARQYCRDSLGERNEFGVYLSVTASRSALLPLTQQIQGQRIQASLNAWASIRFVFSAVRNARSPGNARRRRLSQLAPRHSRLAHAMSMYVLKAILCIWP